MLVYQSMTPLQPKQPKLLFHCSHRSRTPSSKLAPGAEGITGSIPIPRHPGEYLLMFGVCKYRGVPDIPSEVLVGLDVKGKEDLPSEME